MYLIDGVGFTYLRTVSFKIDFYFIKLNFLKRVFHKDNAKLTSYSVRSFAEYATVKGWFFEGSICADDKGYHDNSESQDKTNGNHVGALIYFCLKQKIKNLLIIITTIFL